MKYNLKYQWKLEMLPWQCTEISLVEVLQQMKWNEYMCVCVCVCVCVLKIRQRHKKFFFSLFLIK